MGVRQCPDGIPIVDGVDGDGHRRSSDHRAIGSVDEESNYVVERTVDIFVVFLRCKYVLEKNLIRIWDKVEFQDRCVERGKTGQRRKIRIPRRTLGRGPRV